MTNTAIDYGSLQNSLGFIQFQNSKMSFNSKRFMQLTHLSANETAEKLEKTRTNVYKAIPLKPSDSFRDKIISLVIVSDLAFELFSKNIDETAKWIISPNTLLFGASPFEVCLRGDGSLLQEWLNERLGRKNIVKSS